MPLHDRARLHGTPHRPRSSAPALRPPAWPLRKASPFLPWRWPTQSGERVLGCLVCREGAWAPEHRCNLCCSPSFARGRKAGSPASAARWLGWARRSRWTTTWPACCALWARRRLTLRWPTLRPRCCPRCCGCWNPSRTARGCRGTTICRLTSLSSRRNSCLGPAYTSDLDCKRLRQSTKSKRLKRGRAGPR